jgi:hypothetical protein
MAVVLIRRTRQLGGSLRMAPPTWVGRYAYWSPGAASTAWRPADASHTTWGVWDAAVGPVGCPVMRFRAVQLVLLIVLVGACSGHDHPEEPG